MSPSLRARTGRHIRLAVAGLLEQQVGDPGAGADFGDGKSVLRIVDGGGEEFRELPGAEFLPKGVPTGDAARHRDGVHAARVELGDALALEVVDGECSWSPAAGVEPVNLAGLGFKDDGEEVAAHAVDVGLCEADDRVRGDGRVDRIAAGFQDLRACLRSEEL